MSKDIKFEAYVEDDIIEGRPAETYQVVTLEWDDDGVESANLFSLKTQTFHTLKAKWFKLIQVAGIITFSDKLEVKDHE